MNRNILLAIGFMAMGMILIPVGDAIAKYLFTITPYSATFLSWARFLLGTLILIPIALSQGAVRDLPKPFFVKHSIRGLLIALTVATIIKALSLSPIAEVFGCFFIGPVLSVIFSVVLLRETVGLTDWVSVVLGFVGVLLVIQPALLGLESNFTGSSHEDNNKEGLYWALLAGVFYGAFLVATRWAAGVGPPLAQVSMQFFVATILLLPFAINELLHFGFLSVLWIVLMSVTSVSANYFSILALARAKPATLAPVVYMQVVAATVIGLIMFNEQLNFVSNLGLLVIVLSGFFRIPYVKPD